MSGTQAVLSVGELARYAQGLLFSADSEADMTEEILLVKRMILREFVTA